jgi:hypothetical protein
MQRSWRDSTAAGMAGFDPLTEADVSAVIAVIALATAGRDRAFARSGRSDSTVLRVRADGTILAVSSYCPRGVDDADPEGAIRGDPFRKDAC